MDREVKGISMVALEDCSPTCLFGRHSTGMLHIEIPENNCKQISGLHAGYRQEPFNGRFVSGASSQS